MAKTSILKTTVKIEWIVIKYLVKNSQLLEAYNSRHPWLSSTTYIEGHIEISLPCQCSSLPGFCAQADTGNQWRHWFRWFLTFHQASRKSPMFLCLHPVYCDNQWQLHPVVYYPVADKKRRKKQHTSQVKIGLTKAFLFHSSPCPCGVVLEPEIVLLSKSEK